MKTISMNVRIFLLFSLCYEVDASKMHRCKSRVENKDDINNIRLEMETLRSVLVETVEVNRALEKKVDQLNSHVTVLMEHVRKCNENRCQNKKQKAVRDVPTGPTVAFSVVFYNGGLLRLGQHQVIEYNVIHTNIGNSYNINHAHFIAPVNGVYLLSMTCTNSEGSHLYLDMVKNGKGIAVVYCGGNHFSDMGSQTSVHSLTKDDVIWVRSGYNAGTVLNGSGFYNTFMGVLLFKN